MSSQPSTATDGAAVAAAAAYPSPHLKKVLRSYQSAASSSLSGPNGILAGPEHVEASYYASYNLPKSDPIAPASRIRVKSELMDELKQDNNTKIWQPRGAVEYDEFKVLKLKRPAYYAIVKDKDAIVDLSSQQQTATKPPPSSPQPLLLPSFPILSAADRGWSHAERSETQLEGQPIACFVVGGEPRLCVPQILNSVLRQFFVMQIHAVCDELQINCSRCTAEQLDSLKAAPAILPRSAASCGLITKTDAQRLCSALLRRSNNRTEPQRRTEDGGGVVKTEAADDTKCTNGWFRVYHQCFGKCEGLCKPELYTSPDAGCIECADCSLTFSPADFISHAHRSMENRTCHWGFDSAHWRAYLLLARRQQQTTTNDVLLRRLDELKNRFSSLSVKRKLQTVEETTKSKVDLVDNHQPTKRHKEQGRQSPAGVLATPYDPYYVYNSGNGLRESPPPPLQETPSSRIPHDKAGQPNVALLAPPRAFHAYAEPVGNPEIELSSTDTEDSESIPSHNGDDKHVWDLPENLAQEVSSVEELLKKGGCDSANSRLVLQAFRRLCFRLNWAQDRPAQQQYSPSNAVLKLRTDLTECVDGTKYKST